ncbi:MAG: hypothetical protein KKE30_11490 [Gammaproteobacteria bacterium]|nr:hypothetical protein [Gammaproteobacteria bacterium]MBU1556357.1 hypothetical protein [Gammaproteobacteria bacterium]MBU2069426.1 hypothetical protein [Gammaproteobacteria bacterium]MBU2182931.1 hypothetical protein [Gammaproteobacteria bacterium]MBU2203279.1 hypothetical protein [Gammaproteobacteria bacterium]
MKSVALVTIHGMGETQPDYAARLFRQLTQQLAADATQLYCGTVYYQDLLQYNEQRVWQATGPRLRWSKLRRFMLFGFADAAALEHRKEQPHSLYHYSQLKIARALYLAKQQLTADGKLVILAHSLGCQVLSCYLWDAQQAKAGIKPAAGIWRDIKRYQAGISGDNPLTEEDIAFLRGDRLVSLITTGCNIPIFVAAHAMEQVIPFNKPNNAFVWHNYYDKDDVLGWPLAELSDGYAALVTDIEVNASGGFFGWLAASWNPLSHNQYWQDNQIIDALLTQLSAAANKSALP